MASPQILLLIIINVYNTGFTPRSDDPQRSHKQLLFFTVIKKRNSTFSSRILIRPKVEFLISSSCSSRDCL